MATLSSIVENAVVTVNGPKGDKGDKGDTGASLNNIPSAGAIKVAAYTLTTDDVGDHVTAGTGSSISIPDSTFTAGDVVTIFNDTTGDITINVLSGMVTYIAGSVTAVSSATLDTHGIASILFLSGSKSVISGNVS